MVNKSRISIAASVALSLCCVGTAFATEFPTLPYREMGYSNLKDYWIDFTTKKADVEGMVDQAIDLYSPVITDEQIQSLRDYEEKMLDAGTMLIYNENLEAFNAIVADLEIALAEFMKPVYTAPVAYAPQSYSGGYSSDLLDFQSAGVLRDSQYRYTYYSSNILYHYRTSEWTAGSDGIYRNSAGQVVVASDEYPQGTVVQSDIFGECVVEDCGVGSSGTLDVYTAF